MYAIFCLEAAALSLRMIDIIFLAIMKLILSLFEQLAINSLNTVVLNISYAAIWQLNLNFN